MADFKQGDKIVCIGKDGWGKLSVGTVYVAGRIYSSNNDEWVEVFDIFGVKIIRQQYATDPNTENWFTNRFKRFDDSINPRNPSAPIDDYVCKRCQNPKCSKTERSCWKCGEPIVP